MTPRIWSYIAAVVLTLALFLGVRSCRDRTAIEKRAVAENKVDEWKPRYDSLAVELQRKDSALVRANARALEVANRPPVVVTRTKDVDGESWVPMADFNRAAHRIDSLVVATRALSDTLETYRKIPPQIVAAADTVIRYQRVLIETPAPKNHWSLGVHAGYGETLYQGKLVSGPQVGASLQYNFFGG